MGEYAGDEQPVAGAIVIVVEAAPQGLSSTHWIPTTDSPHGRRCSSLTTTP